MEKYLRCLAIFVVAIGLSSVLHAQGNPSRAAIEKQNCGRAASPEPNTISFAAKIRHPRPRRNAI